MDDASTPRRRLGFRLVSLARRWRQALDVRLAEAGLSDASWAPLVHLRERGDGLSQAELAAAVGLDASSLVRLLDILVAQALVERRPDENDRRLKLIHLTPAGKRKVSVIRRQLAVAEEELLGDLDDADAAAMLQAFDLIEARIDARHPRRKGRGS